MYQIYTQYSQRKVFYFINCQNVVSLIQGENINICWSLDGNTIAVGNKDDLVTFVDTKTLETTEKKFKFEVNEISFSNNGKLFVLTSGTGYIYVLRFV